MLGLALTHLHTWSPDWKLVIIIIINNTLGIYIINTLGSISLLHWSIIYYTRDKRGSALGAPTR
jgi:hypothetical protein